MGQLYFASDFHLRHRNIAKFRCKERGFFRDFENEEDHRMWLKIQWNSRVTKRDKIFCSGDMCFSLEALEDFKTWNGTKVLIAGNHDLDNVSMKDIINSNAYSEVYSLLRYREFWISHAPIHESELRGKYNIHGHTHYDKVDDWRYYNACVEHGILHKLEDVREEFNKRKRQKEYCYEM